MDMDTTSSSRVDENDIFADADADADVDTDTEGPAPAKGAAATKSSAASDGAPASAAAATAGTSDDAKDTQHDGDGDEEEETIDSIESRKLKLLQDLQDHPERFWSSSTSSSSTTNAASASAAASSTTMNENDDKHDEDDESHENPTKRLKIGNTKDSEQIVDKGISPSVMDEELVKTIRTMVCSFFDKGGNSSSINNNGDGDTTMTSAALTTTREGEGTPRGGDETTENEENRSSALNDESASQLLDRVQKELERMASTGRSNGHRGQFDDGKSIETLPEGSDQSKAPVKDDNPSLPNQPSSSSSSSSSSTNVATNVLGWLCLDLKRVVQKATIESDNRNHHLTQNESGKIDARDMTAFAAPSRKPPAAAATNDTDISQDEYATLLCDERLPSSIGGGNDAIETSENNNKPSSSNDDIIQDEDGVSLLMCQENGLFAGDNNNKPSGSASSSTGKPTVTTSVKVGSDVASNVHQQTLAIIRETTRLLRTKTINLTKRRVEGTRNIQQKQTSSSTTTTIDTR